MSIQITKSAWRKIGEIINKTNNSYGLYIQQRPGDVMDLILS